MMSPNQSMRENWDVHDDMRQELLLRQVQEREPEQGQWAVSDVRYHIAVDL